MNYTGEPSLLLPKTKASSCYAPWPGTKLNPLTWLDCVCEENSSYSPPVFFLNLSPKAFLLQEKTTLSGKAC